MENVAIRKLIEVGRLLYYEGLVDARAGNLSVRLEKDTIITRRGTHLGRLSEWDFIRVPIGESHILENRASSELIVHREIYKDTAYKSVVHAHPISTVFLSPKLDVIEPIDSEGRELLGVVKVIPAYKPGSPKLAKAVAQALKTHKIVVVRSHGVFSADFDPFYAYAHISVLERSCKILLHERGELQGL